MKTTLTAFMLTAFALSLNGQELKINETTGKYREENTLVIESAIKDTLFKKTYKWLFTKYPNTGELGTYIDATKNKIVAHQYFRPDPNGLWGLTNLRIEFILTLEFKDFKIKYVYTDFNYFSVGDGKVSFESQKFQRYDLMVKDLMLKATYEHIKNLTAELNAHLQLLKSIKPPAK